MRIKTAKCGSSPRPEAVFSRCPLSERGPPTRSDVTSASCRARPFLLFLCYFPVEASVAALTSAALFEGRQDGGTAAMVSACARP